MMDVERDISLEPLTIVCRWLIRAEQQDTNTINIGRIGASELAGGIIGPIRGIIGVLAVV